MIDRVTGNLDCMIMGLRCELLDEDGMHRYFNIEKGSRIESSQKKLEMRDEGLILVKTRRELYVHIWMAGEKPYGV